MVRIWTVRKWLCPTWMKYTKKVSTFRLMPRKNWNEIHKNELNKCVCKYCEAEKLFALLEGVHTTSAKWSLYPMKKDSNIIVHLVIKVSFIFRHSTEHNENLLCSSCLAACCSEKSQSQNYFGWFSSF